MKSIKSLSREEAHEIIDMVYDEVCKHHDHSEEVGSLFSYKSYGQDTYHHVIVLNCEGEIL